MDETELVRRAVKGDAEAFGNLFERFASDVYRLARSMGHNGEEAEDLMQDTFLAAFEGLGAYEGRSSFKTWLISILFRQSSRRRRYLGIRKAEVFDETQPEPRNNTSGRRVDGSHERRLDALAMLDTLTADHRAVLMLRELQGFSYDEIAAVLDVPRGTVESRLFRARAILRERFQDYGMRPPKAARHTVESRHE